MKLSQKLSHPLRRRLPPRVHTWCRANRSRRGAAHRQKLTLIWRVADSSPLGATIPLTAADFGRSPSDARNRQRLRKRQRLPSSIDQPIPKRRTANHVLEELINYRTSPDLAAVVRSLTGGRGVDGIIDVVGGSNLIKLLDAAADNAHIAIVGFLQGFEVTGNLIAPIMAHQLNIHGVSVGSRRDLERFLADVERHRIEPIVGTVFNFDDAPAALASMAGDRAVGKPVIRLP
jgi:Zinc-binding dehydrogenase